MTRGARHCRFSNFPSRRFAARLSRWLCTSTSSTMPVWFTARQSHQDTLDHIRREASEAERLR
jgi:hypothetical protein